MVVEVLGGDFVGKNGIYSFGQIGEFRLVFGFFVV